MSSIMNKLMLSCLKATELVEKKSAFKLSAIENIQLKAHVSMCNACKEYQKQSSLMDTFFKNHLHSNKEELNSSSRLNPELAMKIITKLNSK